MQDSYYSVFINFLLVSGKPTKMIFNSTDFIEINNVKISFIYKFYKKETYFIKIIYIN